MENKSIEDIIKAERESEKYCDACGLEMNLIKGKRRNNEWDKPHDKYVCDKCGKNTYYDFDFPAPVRLPLFEGDDIIDKYNNSALNRV